MQFQVPNRNLYDYAQSKIIPILPELSSNHRAVITNTAQNFHSAARESSKTKHLQSVHKTQQPKANPPSGTIKHEHDSIENDSLIEDLQAAKKV